jgi:hypothetical protein
MGSLFEYKKKMFTQYTKQLLSIILCSTLVNFYLLVILYGGLLLKKAAIYVAKIEKLLVWNLTKKKYTCLVYNNKKPKLRSYPNEFVKMAEKA